MIYSGNEFTLKPIESGKYNEHEFRKSEGG